MKRLSSFSQKTALLLASVAILNAARADVQYTSVMSTLKDSKMTPLTTTTTWLKEGLQRIDSKIDMGMFRSTETVITDVPKMQRITLDPNLKIYLVEPLGGGKSGTSSTRSGAKPSTTSGSTKQKKSKLVMTMSAKFLGTEKMLNLQARHYTTAMQIDMSGDCGNSNTRMKSEVWMADVKLPNLNIPSDNNGGMSGGGGNDGCAIETESKGDIKTYQEAQKGLAIKSIFFDQDGKPHAQQEITMLSFAALKNGEFATPAGFKRVTRAEYNKTRQEVMMSAMTQPSSNTGNNSSNNTRDEEDEPAEQPIAAPATAPAAAVPAAAAPQPSTRYVPVAVKNDAKLDKALLNAAKNNEVESAISLLQNGANPNTADKGGMTALMFASQGGKPELVQALLDMGANANAVNKKGQTALHLATTIGAPKPKKSKLGGLGGMFGSAVASSVVSGSLGGGLGDLGGAGSWASSLLGGGSVDSLLGSNLQGLLSGGPFNLAGKSGWSAIIGTALQGDLKNNGAFGMQNLLAGGGRLDANNWIGLVGAVKGSNVNVLNAMSNIGGAGNAQWSQFMSAAASGDVASVTNLMGDSKMRPLLNQAMQGFSAASGELPANAAKSIVQSLVQKGANSALADSDGKTAAQLAQARNWNDVAALLQR
ncbi:MAG TPA: ankyrin repeat domain-containing protein [Abditibacteriaceae bacterium]|nr:ankyrin repeat domain-containing protein [Abditibacteriaceae bacterium]